MTIDWFDTNFEKTIGWAWYCIDEDVMDIEVANKFAILDDWADKGEEYERKIRESLRDHYVECVAELKKNDIESFNEIQKTFGELIADMKREKKAVRWYWRLFF